MPQLVQAFPSNAAPVNIRLANDVHLAARRDARHVVAKFRVTKITVPPVMWHGVARRQGGASATPFRFSRRNSLRVPFPLTPCFPSVVFGAHEPRSDIHALRSAVGALLRCVICCLGGITSVRRLCGGRDETQEKVAGAEFSVASGGDSFLAPRDGDGDPTSR